MTTYTAIPNSQIDVDSPVSDVLMTLLRDNPLSIRESAAGAPKIALKTIAGRSTTNGGSVTFTNLSEYQGGIFFIEQHGTSATAKTIELSSDNGSSWGTAYSLGSLENMQFSIDFSTGAIRGQAYSRGTAANTDLAGTVGGAGANVDAIRFANSGNPYLSILAILTGGDAGV